VTSIRFKLGEEVLFSPGYIMTTVICNRQATIENQWVILEPFIGAMQNAFIKFTHGAGVRYLVN